jgi:hypothetical protein
LTYALRLMSINVKGGHSYRVFWALFQPHLLELRRVIIIDHAEVFSEI